MEPNPRLTNSVSIRLLGALWLLSGCSVDAAWVLAVQETRWVESRRLLGTLAQFPPAIPRWPFYVAPTRRSSYVHG
jgi:hypothetical protein